MDLPRGPFLSGCWRAVCSDLSLLWRFFFPEPSGSHDSSLLPFCPTCLGLGRRGSLPKTSVVIRFRVSLSLLVSGFGRRLPGLGDPTGGRPASWSSPGPSCGPRPGGTHGAQAPVRRTSGAQGTLKLPPGLAKTSGGPKLKDPGGLPGEPVRPEDLEKKQSTSKATIPKPARSSRNLPTCPGARYCNKCLCPRRLPVAASRWPETATHPHIRYRLPPPPTFILAETGGWRGALLRAGFRRLPAGRAEPTSHVDSRTRVRSRPVKLLGGRKRPNGPTTRPP